MGFAARRGRTIDAYRPGVEPFLAKALPGSRCPLSCGLRPLAGLRCYLNCMFLQLLVSVAQGMLFHFGRELVESTRRSLMRVDGQPFRCNCAGKSRLSLEITVGFRHLNSGPRRTRCTHSSAGAR